MRGNKKEISGQRAILQAVTSQLPSPLRGLASVFGMGTGVSPSPWPPGNQVGGILPQSARPVKPSRRQRGWLGGWRGWRGWLPVPLLLLLCPLGQNSVLDAQPLQDAGDDSIRQLLEGRRAVVPGGRGG